MELKLPVSEQAIRDLIKVGRLGMEDHVLRGPDDGTTDGVLQCQADRIPRGGRVGILTSSGGAGIIIASGLFVIHRERLAYRPQKTGAETGPESGKPIP